MLSTNNLPSAGQAKTFSPGNQKLKINSIELAKGFKEGSYHVHLNMEGVDLGEGFEGFYIDNVTKTGDRYKGQVGRVRMSQYAYEDGVTKTGTKINRDQSILRGLQNLAKVSGKELELAAVEADTIEEYVPLASAVLSGGPFINFCVGGKEFVNRGGYIQHDMFLPNSRGGQFAFTADTEDPAKLLTFNAATHIIKAAGTAAPVDGFEATKKADEFAL